MFEFLWKKCILHWNQWDTFHTHGLIMILTYTLISFFITGNNILRFLSTNICHIFFSWKDWNHTSCNNISCRCFYTLGPIFMMHILKCFYHVYDKIIMIIIIIFVFFVKFHEAIGMELALMQKCAWYWN